MKINNKPLILIVDDSPLNIKVLKSVLKENDYNVSFTTSGIRALRYLKEKTPDLILLDIQMPDMDGYEVCAKLKTSDKTKDIPVIFLTSNTKTSYLLKGFELGAVDYITKPFKVGELIAHIATHIDLKLAKEKLIEVNRTKDKFFSIISHDLKNPAFAFRFLLEQTISHYSKLSKEEVLDNLNLLHFSSDNMCTLLNNLLLWAKSQSGILNFDPQEQNLKYIIDKNIANCNSAAKNKNISIKSNVNNNLSVFADEMMLSTIIINLLSNAIKFTDFNGEIEVDAVTKDKFIEISIKDFGKGINEADLNKLFHIDSNYSFSGTNKEEGSGLGLILCKEFVLRNGGDIFVKSSLGIGSTFYFLLPNFKLIED